MNLSEFLDLEQNNNSDYEADERKNLSFPTAETVQIPSTSCHCKNIAPESSPLPRRSLRLLRKTTELSIQETEEYAVETDPETQGDTAGVVGIIYVAIVSLVNTFSGSTCTCGPINWSFVQHSQKKKELSCTFEP